MGFFDIHSVAKHQKTERGDTLVSPGIVCCAEKEEKSFWFNSLGQMIQFGTIKFRITFSNYFGHDQNSSKKLYEILWSQIESIVADHF